LIITQIILPGIKGGNHNKSFSYAGGGDKGSGIQSRVIPTDEDLKAIKENKRKIP
jgi:hypothetical protein